MSNQLDSKITVIGGGPGGYVAAIKAAQMGADVILVEKEKVGGTCLNWGCIPTKTLVRSAMVYKEIKDAKNYGFLVDDVKIDFGRLMRRKHRVVSRLTKGVEYLLKKNAVNVIKGTAVIKSPDMIVVEGESTAEIKTENTIIATGSRASSLKIKGADLPGVITSREALEMKELPDRLVIVGAGIIGMEFASIFSTLGVEVTVLEFLDKVLPGIDSDLSRELVSNLRGKPVNIHTGARVNEISQKDDKYIVGYSKEGLEDRVEGDLVLMAVGREPCYGGIELERLGIELKGDKKGIKVNSRMETSVTGIYAIGDVTDKILLAHAASHQGIVAARNIMGEDVEMDYSAVPSIIYTDPEIASVGLDEDKARKQGIEIKVGKFPYSANGKALADGEMSGFIKLIKEKEDGRIIGGSVIGHHASDLIGELTLAVRNGLTAEDIIETIHAHPTTSEIIHEAALDLEGGAINY